MANEPRHENPEDRLLDLLTIREAADVLGVPVKTLYNWRAQSKGPRSFRVGRSIRFTRTDLAAWIAEQRDLEAS